MAKQIKNEIKVKVSCITSYPRHLIDESQNVSIEVAIENYKKSKEWNSVEKPDYMYLEGRRFNDNENLRKVILGNMRMCINNSLFDGHSHADLTDEAAKWLMEDVYGNYLIEILNEPKKLNEWIKATLLYSAGSDYWYTYEKDWN